MNLTQPLPMLILALLDRDASPPTRYSIMITINQMVAMIESPYSPGAIYACVERLSTAKMIKFNHDLIEITPLGSHSIRGLIAVTPLPSGFKDIMYRLLATCLHSDPHVRVDGLKRLDVEMIKFNQFAMIIEPGNGLLGPALNICRQNLSTAIRKSILDIGALK